MSRVGTVEAGSLLAILQSASMGGYGVSVVNTAVRAGALASSAAAYLTRKRREGPKL
jgi:hypothetical protein